MQYRKHQLFDFFRPPKQDKNNHKILIPILQRNLNSVQSLRTVLRNAQLLNAVGVSQFVKVLILTSSTDCIQLQEHPRKVLASVEKLGVDVYTVSDPDDELATVLRSDVLGRDGNRWLYDTNCLPPVILPDQLIAPQDAELIRDRFISE